MRCLFALSATDEAISTAEEGELYRIGKELRIDHSDLVALRTSATSVEQEDARAPFSVEGW